MADLDSTFEEYTRPDRDKYFKDGYDQFAPFIKFVKRFEREVDAKVAIHFISGTSKTDFCERVNFFKEKYPEIYERIAEGIVERGVVMSPKKLIKVDECSLDGAPYSKADAVYKIHSYYKFDNVVGACYMGDSSVDLPAFRMLKMFTYPLGSYTIAPKSSQGPYMSTQVDFHSIYPRILGCTDGLVRMEKDILQKINNNTKQESEMERGL